MINGTAPSYRVISHKTGITATKNFGRVGESCLGLVEVGEEFDLDADWQPAMEACCSHETLADAIGMLTAIAGTNDRTAGFEKAVYVIQVGDDPICKIGISANPLKRIEDLQASHYRELFLYAVVFCPLRQSLSIEQDVLSIATGEGKRLMGEWVNYPPEDVLRMIFRVSHDCGYSICDGRKWFDNMVARTRQLHRNRKKYADAQRRLRNRRRSPQAA